MDASSNKTHTSFEMQIAQGAQKIRKFDIGNFMVIDFSLESSGYI